MELQFIIDKEYDKSFLIKGKPLENLIKRAHFELDYLLQMAKLEESARTYQESWEQIMCDFSETYSQITGYPFFHETYECVISVHRKGVSNWGKGNRIMRAWKLDGFGQRKITAHEILLSHYFEIYKRVYNEESLSDFQVWALAEVGARALTTLHRDARSFWRVEMGDYDKTLGYGFRLEEVKTALKPLFIRLFLLGLSKGEKNPFDQYIKEGISLIKRYPDISPREQSSYFV